MWRRQDGAFHMLLDLFVAVSGGGPIILSLTMGCCAPALWDVMAAT